MKISRLILGLLLPRAWIWLFALPLNQACQAAPTVTLDLASDFKFQGEYAGISDSSGVKLGIQVVAKGQGAFSAVILSGGLPGAGWDEKTRVEQSGTLVGDSIVFAAQGASSYSVTLMANGLSLKGKTPQGESFAFSKVERKSATLGLTPPPMAKVIFDGKDLSSFVNGSAVLDSGLLLPQGSASSGAATLSTFGSFSLHLEFLVPFMPDRTGQARGNSGIYLQGRYELQILDSFGLDFLRGDAVTAMRECGAFFEMAAPRLNMSFPPLRWQTYDLDFTAAEFSADGKTQIRSALVTVKLNGVLIHENRELPRNTLLGDVVGSGKGPLRFQAHGDPVKFQNIWVVEKEGLPIRSTFRPSHRGLAAPEFNRKANWPWVNALGRWMHVFAIK